MAVITRKSADILSKDGNKAFLFRAAVQMVRQPFQYRTGAGAAAAVEQKGRPAAAQPRDFFFHFPVVIPFRILFHDAPPFRVSV